MRTIYTAKRALIILFASFIVACGAETLAAIIFLPTFAATWPVIGDGDYFIDLRPDDSVLSETGVFTGEERHYGNPDLDENAITGSFDGLSIEFTIVRPTENVQYTGTMTPVSDENHSITRIELTSSEGNLVLGVE